MSQDILNNESAVQTDGADSAPSASGETAGRAGASPSEQENAAESPSAPETASAPASEPKTCQAASDPSGSEKPDKKKKPKKAGKAILIIFAVLLFLILLLAGAAFFTARAMLIDDMPQAPVTVEVSSGDIDALITSSAKEILFEKTMTLDSSPINSLLCMLKETVNDSADGFRVEDLFCEFSGDKGSVYARVYADTIPVNGRSVKLDRMIPASLCFDTAFEDPYMVLIPTELRCGTVDVPEFVLNKILDRMSSAGNTADGSGGGTAPDENAAFIKDGKIYVDISDISSYAAQQAEYEINGMLSDRVIFESYREAAGDDSILGYIGDTADVGISGINIANGKLVISADVSMLLNRVHDSLDENVIAGDYFFFGAYPQSAGEPEPIEWYVLDVRDGKALAVSKTLLDCKLYNDEYKKVTWSECSLRKWLNGGFYDTAFSDSEKSRIQTVKNDNPDNNITGAAGGPDTEDKVFCLSLDEARSWGNTIDLKAAVTEYAISRGAETSSQFIIDGRKTGYWWLRSPGMDNMAAACVYPNGQCSHSGQYFVSVHDVCVRPVIEVSLTE